MFFEFYIDFFQNVQERLNEMVNYVGLQYS